ncbi:MAG: peroxidase-related enzyme [Planctomycetota bacterium]|nr:peroxidase-related enzyme [Planctomycetota bacterium]
MTRIQTISDDKAEGKLKELFEKIGSARGGVANILRANSVNPNVLEAHFELYKALMFGKSPLSRRERELAAVVVSVANNCFYCKSHHGEALIRTGATPEFVSQIKSNWENANLTKREKRICKFAVRLTQKQASMSKKHIEKLKRVGLDDRAIHDLTMIVSYFNMVNRLVSALDIELEPDFEETC